MLCQMTCKPFSNLHKNEGKNIMHDQKKIKGKKGSDWVVKVVMRDTTDSDACIVQYMSPKLCSHIVLCLVAIRFKI